MSQIQKLKSILMDTVSALLTAQTQHATAKGNMEQAKAAREQALANANRASIDKSIALDDLRSRIGYADELKNMDKAVGELLIAVRVLADKAQDYDEAKAAYNRAKATLLDARSKAGLAKELLAVLDEPGDEMGEIISLLSDLFDASDIGCYPERNDNGADAYICPSCGGRKEVQGSVFGTAPINLGEHTADCKLQRLHTLVRKLAQE